MAPSLKSVLMRRDGLSSSEADELIASARKEFNRRLMAGEDPSDLMEEEFY
jgi:hypothetical protein